MQPFLPKPMERGLLLAIVVPRWLDNATVEVTLPIGERIFVPDAGNVAIVYR
ncbi:MAG: hypothetical protein ACYC0C_18165 [Devosia sp.]